MSEGFQARGAGRTAQPGPGPSSLDATVPASWLTCRGRYGCLHSSQMSKVPPREVIKRIS